MNATAARLAPGQCYAQPGDAPRLDRLVTIARLDRDAHGLTQVTFRAPDGRELIAYAAQVEAAIDEGFLAPLAVAEAA